MDVTLTPELEQIIQARIDSGQYSSASEVVREGLRLLEERDDPLPSHRADTLVVPPTPLWRRIREIVEQVPAGERSRLPNDLAEQHDHYIYGTPRRQ